MDWNRGYSSQNYATFVDPVTWRDIDRFEITEGTVKRTDTGLRQSADIKSTRYTETAERWVRIWMDCKQEGGSSDHVPIFTGLAVSPEKNFDGNLKETPLTCYSVLQPAKDIPLPLGFYAPMGISGGQLVKQLLSAVIPAPITVVDNSPPLAQYIIAEDGEDYLSMSEKILSAIGWRLTVNGLGEVAILPIADTISASFDPLNNDSIEPQVNVVNDFFKCPNVFRAIMDDTSAVARDDSDTPLSVTGRGREVWMEERDCKLNENETLAEYAQRRLKEEQRYYLTVDYDRRYYPDVFPSDLIRLHYPAQDIDGVFYVTEQSIKLGYASQTSEEVIQL